MKPPQKPVLLKPISLRITADTRAQLDILVERTGLKDAQIIRMAIKLMAEGGQFGSAAAPKPARTPR
jgi:hypothetical protein